MKNNSLILLILGILAGLFFSATFVINHAISLENGHWFWSASLRYVYMILFLSLGIIIFKGFPYFKSVVLEFLDHYIFWLIAGSIGFGGFYALLCFAADFSPGWVIATTWQITIIASLIILAVFGQKVSKLTIFFAFIVFIGVTLVNISNITLSNLEPLLYGAIPVLLASFCYPIGNQMLWEEKHKRSEIKNSDMSVLNNPFAKVFLLSLGSIPFWIILYLLVDSGLPSKGQIFSVALIALFSGVIATTLFLYARSKATTASQIAVVDATQSSEVVFALCGEVIFLGLAFPNLLGFIGIIITLIGLGLLVYLNND